MIQERVCRDWLDVQQVLKENSWDEGLGRHRSRAVYRGLPDAAFRLTTTPQRLGGPYERLETHLVRNFSKYAYDMVASTTPGLIMGSNGNSIWNWLFISCIKKRCLSRITVGSVNKRTTRERRHS